MSKKQQVEKVQRCNAVISAFQAGVKERPAGAKQQEEVEVEEKEPPAGPSAAPEERSPEEAKPEAADRDACRVNQEAWSRLRDGKGVEPEDLDKSHQLTPPAFVRPKRQADDDQPVEVEQDKKEQVGGTWWSTGGDQKLETGGEFIQKQHPRRSGVLEGRTETS